MLLRVTAQTCRAPATFTSSGSSSSSHFSRNFEGFEVREPSNRRRSGVGGCVRRVARERAPKTRYLVIVPAGGASRVEGRLHAGSRPIPGGRSLGRPATRLVARGEIAS